MIKIRLARKGRTHYPLYNIVVADVKASRDGRFLEKIGHYDPHTEVSTVTMKTDRLISWLFKGAQITDKVRNLCTNAGLLLTKHLLEGLKKGAVSKKTAHQRLSLWQKMVEKRKKPKINFTPSIPLAELIDAEPYADAPTPKAAKKPAKITSKKSANTKAAKKAAKSKGQVAENTATKKAAPKVNQEPSVVTNPKIKA